MEWGHLKKLDVSCGHEPRQRVGRGVLTAPRPGGLRTARPTLRFMDSLLSFFTCIGAMNLIGTPLPALSPQGGERVAEGRERGGSWKIFRL